VIAKCYARHLAQRKLLRETEGRQEAHEEGRPRQIPQEAFLAVLKVNDESNPVDLSGSHQQALRSPSAFISRGNYRNS